MVQEGQGVHDEVYVAAMMRMSDVGDATMVEVVDTFRETRQELCLFI